MAAQTKEIFKFNLIPPRPVLEVEIEEERDRSVVYAVLLVFFASLVYFLLGLLQLAIVDPRVKALDQTILNRQQTIASYASIQGLHGELVIKTETLEPVLAKKVNPDEIFRIADSIVSSTSGTQVESYSREPSGLFVFQLKSRNFVELSDLIANIEDIQGVSDVFMRSAVLNVTDLSVTSTVALKITNI